MAWDLIKVGDVFKTNSGQKVEVVEYGGTFDVKVRFIDTGEEKVTRAHLIKKGSVRGFLTKTVYGVGFLGIGSYSASSDKRAYISWKSMMDRCYSDKLHSRYPTYKSCIVCEEWRNFQNFAEWYYDNYIEGYHLDKDIKVKGNKIYSPETCMFVTQRDNVAHATSKDYRFVSPEGFIFIIRNLRRFCKSNKLSYKDMIVTHGISDANYNGWTRFEGP